MAWTKKTLILPLFVKIVGYKYFTKRCHFFCIYMVQRASELDMAISCCVFDVWHYDLIIYFQVSILIWFPFVHYYFLRPHLCTSLQALSRLLQILPG